MTTDDTLKGELILISVGYRVNSPQATRSPPP